MERQTAVSEQAPTSPAAYIHDNSTLQRSSVGLSVCLSHRRMLRLGHQGAACTRRGQRTSRPALLGSIYLSVNHSVVITRNLRSHIDLHTHAAGIASDNRVTLTFDLLNLGLIHAQVLSYAQSLVLI